MALSYTIKVAWITRGIASKNNAHIYFSNCLHSLRTENELKCHEKMWTNKDLCGIVMPSQKDNILKLNQYIKSNKIPYIT